MSTLIVNTIEGKDGRPVSFPNGISVGSGTPSAHTANNAPGQPGFGVGICPGPLPAGFVGLTGYTDCMSDNYGNYQYSDGSIMVWIPAFYYKWGTGANGLAINAVDIIPFVDIEFADIAAANAAGYALHRAFYDGGAVQPGVFVDKYLASNNNGIASSLRNGIPLSSAVRGTLTGSAFANLNGAPANARYGAIVVAKTRGANFFCNSRFIFAALAMLSYAHGQATTKTYCAWYHTTNNFPKGCNNNALGDAQDTALLYTADGSGLACGKTGSANLFARTTHNGQNSGVCDLNGVVYEVTPGLTSNGTNLYVLKTSARMKDLTAGNTLATDLWGANGLAALYDNLGTAYGAWRETGVDRSTYYGSASQVFSEAVSGNAWNWAGAGGLLATGDGGTNAFGSDVFYDYAPNEMCPISGGNWNTSSGAGVWALNLNSTRGDASPSVGCRAACYL